MKEELVPLNPCMRIDPRGKETERDRVLTPDEMKRFWFGIGHGDRAMSHAVRDVLRLALLCGQRLSEVAQAQIAEFDFERRIWTIPGSRTKSGKAHVVPLPSKALRSLRRRSSGADASMP